jgi:hypothetical protein
MNFSPNSVFGTIRAVTLLGIDLIAVHRHLDDRTPGAVRGRLALRAVALHLYGTDVAHEHTAHLDVAAEVQLVPDAIGFEVDGVAGLPGKCLVVQGDRQAKEGSQDGEEEQAVDLAAYGTHGTHRGSHGVIPRS